MSRDSKSVNESNKGEGDYSGIFLSFFYLLRARGLNVTPNQWLTLIKGLALGLHGSSLTGFYSMARAILVKDESELDDFDLVFAEHFKGIEAIAAAIKDEVWEWLENPIDPREPLPDWQVLDDVDMEELRRQFEERLKEQDERHDGGDHWIGTGGTSPFGNYGFHPGGIRVGGERRLGSAVQVAAERRYRKHRRDLVLDTRQFGMALKKLRALKRDGIADNLDIDDTVDKTAKEGGELELVFKPPKVNNLSLILAMDVGGSMEPFRRLTDLLFSAAYNARHFKHFEHYYFHNCVYEQVYEDTYFSKPIPLHELVQRFNRETRLVFVGDAYMYPGELTQRHGAINWQDNNEQPGVVYLQRLREHFKYTAWLNPMNQRMWQSSSVHMINRLFPMYPLTVDGVESLARDLAKGS